MLAGFAAVEITPPLGVELCGYGYYLNRRAGSVLDPLYVRSLCLTDGDRTVFLVCCDLLGLSRAVAGKVREALRTAGFDPDGLMLVSIHTHTGPCVKYHEGCGYPDGDYVEALPGRIAQACLLSAQDRKTVTEMQAMDGAIPEGLIYNRSSENGYLDLGVRGQMIRCQEGAPVVLVSAACHPVTLGRAGQVSADYPGAVCRRLEAEGYRAMYLNGLCGDVDPVRREGMSGPEMRDDLAEHIAEALESGKRSVPVSFSWGRIPFALRLMPVTREAIRESARQAVERAGGEQEPAARVARIWEKEMLEKADTLSFEEPISIPYLVLGGRLILALPFEGFGLIGDQVRKKLDRPDTAVLGCGEELLGYLPTRDDIARGAYAALESTYLYKRLPVLPGEAERLGEELARYFASMENM